MIGTRLPGEGALWMSQNFTFALPVRLGDVLTVSCTVLEKNERERILDLETTVTNQDAATVISGRGQVQVLDPAGPRRSSPEQRLKVAIVTGGSGGIGAAICARLAADGFAVVVGYRSEEARRGAWSRRSTGAPWP